MNQMELKNDLLAAGVTEEALTKLDLTKIEEIISGANNIDEICTKMKEAYPDFNETEFKKSITETAKNSEATQDLSDDTLEEVAGGSAGSWLKKNYETICRVVVLAGILGFSYAGGKYVGNIISKKISMNQYHKALTNI